MDAGLKLVNIQSPSTVALRHFHKLLVESFEDRSHSDHRGGPDQHPQNRQESAEFVGPQRVQRQKKVFANRLSSLGHA